MSAGDAANPGYPGLMNGLPGSLRFGAGDAGAIGREFSGGAGGGGATFNRPSTANGQPDVQDFTMTRPIDTSGKNGIGLSRQPFQQQRLSLFNRTDIMNIVDDAQRLDAELRADGVDALVRQNVLLHFEHPNILQDALLLAQQDISNVLRIARTQEGINFGRENAFSGVPGAGLVGVVVNAVLHLVTLEGLVNLPAPTGPVAIPCGTDGCDVYVGDRKVQFGHEL